MGVLCMWRGGNVGNCYQTQGTHHVGALFKNKRWLLQGSFIYFPQVKEAGDLCSKLCILEVLLYTIWSITHLS